MTNNFKLNLVFYVFGQIRKKYFHATFFPMFFSEISKMSSTTTTTVTQEATITNGTSKSSTTLLADTDPDALLSEWLGELENLIGVSFLCVIYIEVLKNY